MKLDHLSTSDSEERTDTNMAYFLPKPIPASEWTHLDVEPYKINVVRDDMESFFGISQLPSAAATRAPKEIFQCEGFESGKFQEKDARLFYTLGLKANVIGNEGIESPVGDFAAHILSCFGFDEPDGLILRQYGIEFTSCDGNARPTQLDVCVEKPDVGICLIVVKVRHRAERKPFDYYAQFIAKAVAAFQYNKAEKAWRERMRNSGKESAMMYGIIMTETQPTFLKMEITEDLSRAICECTRPSPEQTTTVHVLIPPIPPNPSSKYPHLWGRFGYMSNSACRDWALRCFEAVRRDIEKTRGV